MTNKNVNKNVNNGDKTVNYGFYSKVLNKPFDSLSELMAAEEAYANELKAKEDKAATKKADAQKVEEAFKALNAARKDYKEKITQLTTEYHDALSELKNAFELGRKDITAKLASAEETYAAALKEFTSKYESGYHLTLKDGDFETTISGSGKTAGDFKPNEVFDLFNVMFGF